MALSKNSMTPPIRNSPPMAYSVSSRSSSNVFARVEGICTSGAKDNSNFCHKWLVKVFRDILRASYGHCDTLPATYREATEGA